VLRAEGDLSCWTWSTNGSVGEHGLTALDADNPAYRGMAVAATIEISVRRLTADEQARFRAGRIRRRRSAR
jgi:hypothetical protein